MPTCTAISSKASGKLSAGSRITSASHGIFRDVVLVYLLLKITGLLTLTTYNSTTVSRRFKLTVKLKWEVIPRLVLSVWCSVDRKCPEWRLTPRDFAVRYRGCSYSHSRPVMGPLLFVGLVKRGGKPSFISQNTQTEYKICIIVLVVAIIAEQWYGASECCCYSVPVYDTIRDAILTCARKPTWVGLIYRTV